MIEDWIEHNLNNSTIHTAAIFFSRSSELFSLNQGKPR